jgi:hypothetical protein
MAQDRAKDVNNRSALYGVADEMKQKFTEHIEQPLKEVGKQIGDLKDTMK